ncbi:hypothetical protein QQ045_027399 [Rhodiola kirilowii]
MELVATSEAHPETMDYLSNAWCDFAVQTLKGNNKLPLQTDRSLVLVTDASAMAAGTVHDHGSRVDDESDLLPPWKSNDLKSWIWMQQALHPELNYNTYIDRKPWFTWRKNPFKNSIQPFKKWLEDLKQKRKEEKRLKRAEVHGAVSIAGVAAALASIAADNSKNYDKTSKESAVASAAALVASQCAEMAFSMGATKEQLGSILASAKTATNATDILTLTAAAATSVRGADTLKARKQCTNIMKGVRSSVMSIKETDHDKDEEGDFDFEHGRSHLSKGEVISIETSDGESIETWISIDLNSKAEVIAKMKRPTKTFILKTFSTKKESIVMDLHVELYSDPEDNYTTCYLIVLTTNRGMIKLDMSNDYARYKMWLSTVKHMLLMSLSLARIM